MMLFKPTPRENKLPFSEWVLIDEKVNEYAYYLTKDFDHIYSNKMRINLINHYRDNLIIKAEREIEQQFRDVRPFRRATL